MGDRNMTIRYCAEDTVMMFFRGCCIDLTAHQNRSKWRYLHFPTTKCMTTPKIPISFHQQEVKFKYLSIETSGYGGVETEVRCQTTKAIRIAASVNGMI